MNILFLDIEATDLNADIGNLLSIGYKWQDEKKVHVLSVLEHPGKNLNDDRPLLKAFEPIFQKADLVVHHFGDYYDIPFLQTRRLVHGMPPMPSVKTVDTWRICKKHLRFGSNRLQRVLDALKCPYQKTPLRLSVWADARVGIKSAIKYIITHNYWDVKVLEWVYNKLAPVYPSHPKIVASPGNKYCPLCGGASRSLGHYVGLVHRVQRRICKKCGKSWRGDRIS